MELNISHQPAAHCENGSISALLRYHGVNLSEPMIFGLASGIFFTHIHFVKMGGMPVTAFRTFPGVFFNRVTRLLGIKTATRRFFSQEQSMRALDKVLLDDHEPVGCVVGMYYIPYMPKEYRFHFNGHNIVISGKDETTGNYTVLDGNATEKVQISSRDLQRVRFPKGGVYPLMGQMYWIKSMPERLPDLRPLVLKAIKKACWNMVSQPKVMNFVGVNGIRTLSKRIRNWEKTMGKQRAALNLAQVIRMLEEIGTGGAGFRFLYGAFLQEASELTGIAELNDYSRRITDIGDLWREFALKASRIFKRRAGDSYTYDDLGDILLRIADMEESFFKDLGAEVEKHIK